MTGAQQLWHGPSSIVAGACIMWTLKQSGGETVTLSRILSSQHSRKKAGKRIDDDHRRQLAAGEHKISNGDFIRDKVLPHALIYAFIAAANQDQTIFPGQFLGSCLAKRPALRRQQDDGAVWIERFPAAGLIFNGFRLSNGLNGREDRLWFEYHAASFSPIPAQIAVVDVQALVKKAVEKNAAQTEDDAKTLTARVKATTDKLVLQGVVVLDAQSVLNAPEEAYVSIE